MLPPPINNRLMTVKLTDEQRAREYRHTVTTEGKSTRLPPPYYLSIEEHAGEFITWHWDGDGKPQSHTHRDSLEEALEQAFFEFGVAEGEWVKP